MSLYPPPKEMSSVIWTRLPDAFRNPDGEPEWARGNRPGQKVHSFLEGPSFDRNGDLHVTDIPWPHLQSDAGARMDVDRGVRWLAEWAQNSPRWTHIHYGL